jgi:K+-sensing histidine kinase KdpD
MKYKKRSIRGPSMSIYRHTGRGTRGGLKKPEGFAGMGKIPASFPQGVRSPLNVIMGSVAFLRRKYADDRTLVGYADIMEQQVLQLDKFIAEFLSTGISDQDSYETDLISVLKKIEALVSVRVLSGEIKASFEYGYASCVAVDSSHLELAVLNVIDNAIDAMPYGGTLSVRTQAGTIRGHECAAVVISDTAQGMLRNDRSGRSLPSKEKGRDPGLFITREILCSRGGHLEANGGKSKGNTVKLYIPNADYS